MGELYIRIKEGCMTRDVWKGARCIDDAMV